MRCQRLDDLYARAGALPKAPQAYKVVESATAGEILWPQAKRADDVTTETGTGDGQVTSFAGSVRGVDGTFSCMGDACTAPTPNADGAFTRTEIAITRTEKWSFAPDDPGAMIHVKDTACVSFGWWLNAMGTEGEYKFDAFASATGMGNAIPDDDDDNRAGSVLKGSATYKGGAAGKYAMQSTTDDSASGGHFTASATLTANFDADTDPADDDPNESGVSIGGTITDFMTGDMSRPNWKVTLTGPARVPTTIENTGIAEGRTTSWTTGGAVPDV